MNSPGRAAVTLFFCVLSLPFLLPAQEPRVELRYDLRPGDHLVYRETFERDGTNSHYQYDFRHHKEWTSHVLVLGKHDATVNIGFQRNLEKAELLRFRPKGKDKLEEERPRFAEQVASRSPYFAETNQLDLNGWPRLHWSAVRESWSEILFEVHELVPLPLQPVRPGDAWKAASILGLEFRASGWDVLQGQDCLRVDGSAQENRLHLRYWFCPESGTLARLEFEGSYPVFAGRFTEKLTFELVERRRGETAETWLGEKEVQQGALASLVAISPESASPEALTPLIENDDPDVARRALAVFYRHRLPPPPLKALATAAESPHARVRALAVRVLESFGKSDARPLIEKALEDQDSAVRWAALDWVRDRLPPEEALGIATAERARAVWDRLSDLSVPSPIEAAAGAPASGDPPAAACEDMAEWTARARRSRATPLEMPGTTVRGMSTPGYEGWPYALHIPDDYRGDHAFPLLIYLSGDNGRALHGVAYSRDTLPKLGYLVLLPQANGYWWDEEPTARSTALLKEVLRDFNVDPNRVYLAGTSNGGTGMIRYAAWWDDRLAASVSLMGAGLYSANDSEPPLIVNLLHLPFLFLHGKNDKTIPPQASRDTYEAMRKLDSKAPVTLHIFDDHAHDLVLDNDEGETFAFLERFERDPFPRRVVFQVEDMRFHRRFWLEILEKEKGPAEIHGAIDDDNTIRVDTHAVMRLRLLLRPELLPRHGPLRVVLNGKEVYQGEISFDCGLLHKSLQESADPYRAHSAELTFDVNR